MVNTQVKAEVCHQQMGEGFKQLTVDGWIDSWEEGLIEL